MIPSTLNINYIINICGGNQELKPLAASPVQIPLNYFSTDAIQILKIEDYIDFTTYSS